MNKLSETLSNIETQFSNRKGKGWKVVKQEAIRQAQVEYLDSVRTPVKKSFSDLL